MAKDNRYNRLIHTTRWLKLRREKLTSNPLCERCEQEGRLTPATEVHHIRPAENALNISDMEALMYDWYNLRSLCHACHVKTHTEAGRSGKVQARNRAREHLKAFCKKFLEGYGKT